MSIFLVVVTSDRALRHYVGTQKHRVFPRDSIKNGLPSTRRASPIVNAVDANDFTTSGELEALIADKVDPVDNLFILIDSDRKHLTRNIQSAALVCDIDRARAVKSYQNYMHERLGKMLKTIKYLGRYFLDGGDGALLSLPLRNFDCVALENVKMQIADDPCSKDLARNIEANFQLLRRRVRPRKKSTYKTKYAVDDQKRFFVFGKEHHALPGTGAPHQIYCMLNARFRFGCRIDHTRHYNVSEGESDRTQISGRFFDCHGEVHQVRRQTHINMFSNDFF